jgi:hypothetical protein
MNTRNEQCRIHQSRNTKIWPIFFLMGNLFTKADTSHRTPEAVLFNDCFQNNSLTVESNKCFLFSVIGSVVATAIFLPCMYLYTVLCSHVVYFISDFISYFRPKGSIMGRLSYISDVVFRCWGNIA